MTPSSVYLNSSVSARLSKSALDVRQLRAQVLAVLFRRLAKGCSSSALKVQGLGFEVWDLGFGVEGLGFGVQGLGFRVWVQPAACSG